jgi:hypothetical protein
MAHTVIVHVQAMLKIGSSHDRYSTQTELFLVVPEENYYIAVSSHDRDWVNKRQLSSLLIILFFSFQLIRFDRMGLAKLIRFLVVKLTHPYLNPRFDICIIFTLNYFFSDKRRPCRQRDALSDRLRKSQDQTGSIFHMCS